MKQQIAKDKENCNSILGVKNYTVIKTGSEDILVIYKQNNKTSLDNRLVRLIQEEQARILREEQFYSFFNTKS